MTEQNTPLLGWTAIYVTDIQTALDFYTTAFGLTVGFAHPGGDYAEFATGATALALIQRSLAAESTGLELTGNGEPTGNITLVVGDVAAAHRRALDAGASEVTAPVTKPWGQTTSYVSDNDGNLIELATVVTKD